MSKIAVIGSGFSSMSAAAYLAQAGHQVEVFEKNSHPGGRASVFRHRGFTFDMGPSWYWMPDIIEDYFSDFGKSPAHYYQLERLDPSYRVFYPENETIDIPAAYDQVRSLFETMEPGAAGQLDQFLSTAEKKYNIGIKEFASLPANNAFEYLKLDLIKNAPRMQLLSDFKTMVDKRFSDHRLRLLMYFPILFLGVSPEKCPAMYSLMNYADIKLGTWYPKGGMNQLSMAMFELASELGVKFHFTSPVTQIHQQNGIVKSLEANGTIHQCDAIVSGADYQHVDQSLLHDPSYSSEYWDTRVMSPSSLIFFIGLNTKVPGLEHHNLFFDKDLIQHSREIYDSPSWPKDPLFYVCCPSKTDSAVAPDGKENLFILMPLASGLEDNQELRVKYKRLIISRLEERLGFDVGDHIEFSRSYCINDFKEDYNSFKGNAYGLANTLSQTAFLKPKIRNKVLKNLYHCGQLTTPGPGVPPSIMSGKIAANELLKDFAPKKINSHERAV